MLLKTLRYLTIIFLIVVSTTLVMSKAKQAISFAEDFEKGLGKWDLVNADKIRIEDSGDSAHGKVMTLYTGGEAVYALIKGSDGWTDYKIEGDIFFPEYTCSYLGLIYNYNVRGPRTDFGSIFILGPYGEDLEPYFQNYRKHIEWPPDHFLGNVIWVNPHRDGNASRNLYGEYWVTLTGPDAVKPGEWRHFKAEILGPVCHFYVTDMQTPKVTYDDYEFSSGRVGFKPRYSGAEVRIDNIKVTPITGLSYNGPGLPAGRTYKPGKLLTAWEILGPFSSRVKALEDEGCLPGKTYTYRDRTYKWEPFAADSRGCVLTGKVTYRFNYRFFAYLHTEIHNPGQEEKEVSLEFSSTHPLVVWVNGKPIGGIKPAFVCWYDFWENPDHEDYSEKLRTRLKPGKNHIVVLAKTPVYGGDGFYAYCNWNVDAAETKSK